MMWLDILIFLDVWLGCGILAAGFMFAECKRNRATRDETMLCFTLCMGLALGPVTLAAAIIAINPLGRYGWSLSVV